VIAKARHAQTDALQIESLALIRLATEYDAAQQRGEIAARGQHGSSRASRATYADIGVNFRDVWRARLVRDAETKSPGVVRRSLDDMLASGRAPSKGALHRALHLAARPAQPNALTPIEIVRLKLRRLMLSALRTMSYEAQHRLLRDMEKELHSIRRRFVELNRSELVSSSKRRKDAE
jgi:hypothetical protein